jgi:hypothetical protein
MTAISTSVLDVSYLDSSLVNNANATAIINPDKPDKPIKENCPKCV